MSDVQQKPLRSRTRRWWALGVVGLVLVGLLWFCGRDPDYQFRLTEIREPSQIEQLSRLVHEINQIKAWKPTELEPQRIADLVDWIRFSSNSQAKSIRDLERSSGDAKFATLNGTLSLLPNVSSADLDRWRTAKIEDVRAELTRLLTAAIDRRREGSVRQAVHALGGQVELSQLGLPPFPDRPHWSRRTVRGVLGGPIRDAELWTNVFLDAYEKDLAPVAKFHELIIEQRSLNLGADPRSALVLRAGKGKSGTDQLTKLRGVQSTSTWELWFVQRDAQGAMREIATGILFNDVPWSGLKRDAAGRLVTPSRDDVHPAWPPPAEADHVALQQLEPFLDRLGFPRDLELSTDENVCEIDYAGDWKLPRIELRVKGVTWVDDISRDTDAWHGDVRLTLSSNATYETLQQETETQTRQFQTELAKHVTRWDHLAGFPVTIHQDEQGTGRLTAKVQPPEAPAFTLRGSIDQDCHLKFESLPTEVRERRAWTDLLAGADNRLTGWQDLLRLRSVEIERDSEAVAVTADVPHPKTPNKWLRVTASRPAKGKLKVDVPDIPDTTSDEGKKSLLPDIAAVLSSALNNTSDANPDFTVEMLEQAARESIQTRYPKLAPYVEVISGKRGGQKTLRCGLRLADWPTLELGPVVVDQPADVSRHVEQLLSQDSLHKASLVQWRPDRDQAGAEADGGWHHLRLNDVAGTISQWNPDEPSGMIGCKVNLGLQPLDWSEKLQLVSGQWNEDLVADLQDKIKGQLSLKFGADDERLPEALRGLILSAETNPGRFGPGRWLRMRPLTVALRGTVLIPWFGFQTEASVLLDQDGFHAEDVSLSVPGTIPLPNMAISDPRITINFEKQSLVLDAKFTPPVILPKGDKTVLRAARFMEVSSSSDTRLRIDNPWLHAACLHMTLQGRLKDPQIKAGATLEALQQLALAQGQVQYHVDSSDFRGELAALRDVPYMETIPLQLGGKVHYSGQDKFFSLSGGAGQESNAWAQIATLFRWDDRTPTDHQAQFDGHVRVPFLGSLIKASGHSDAKLEKYLVNAKGEVGLWYAELEVDPHDVRWTWGMKDFPDLKYLMSAPALNLFPEEEVGQKLNEIQARSKDRSQAPRIAAAEEQQFVERRFVKRKTNVGTADLPMDAQPDPGSLAPMHVVSTIPTPVELDANQGESSLQLFPSQIYFLLVDGMIECFRPNNEKRDVLFKYPQARIGMSSQWNHCSYWYGQQRSADHKSHVLLIHDPAGSVWNVTVPDQGGHDAITVRDLASDLRSIGMELPSVMTIEQQKQATRVELERKHFQQAVIWHWFLMSRSPVFSDVRLHSAEDGYELEYSVLENGAKSSRAYFIQWRKKELLFVSLDPKHIAAPQRKTVQGLLKERELPHRQFTVSAVGDNVMAGWGRQDTGWAVSLVTRDKASLIPLTLSGYASPESFKHHQWGQAALQSGCPTGGDHAFFGPQGAAIQEGESLWLCRLEDSPLTWVKLQRDQFVKGADGIAQRLPSQWRTREQRQQLPWKDVAIPALADWKELRRQNAEWGVNPLIMLTGLAKAPMP